MRTVVYEENGGEMKFYYAGLRIIADGWQLLLWPEECTRRSELPVVFLEAVVYHFRSALVK